VALLLPAAAETRTSLKYKEMKKKEQSHVEEKRLKRKTHFTKHIQLGSFKWSFASGCRIAFAGTGFHTNNSPSSLIHVNQL